MLRKAGILILAGALGTGSALGVAGCGEKRGTVKFEGDTGGTATAGTVGTSPTTPETSQTTTGP